MSTTPKLPYQRVNEELAKGEAAEKGKAQPIPTYLLKFQTESGRWFEVRATDETIAELLLPSKRNQFNPRLKGLKTFLPQPLPPCLAPRPQHGKNPDEKPTGYSEAA